MKKISLIALLVLVGLIFAAPAARAQEANNDDAAKEEKVKKVASFEDDEQLGNFLAGLSDEDLAAVVAAVVESGDAALRDRVANVLDTMGKDINSALNPAVPGTAGAGAQSGSEGEAGSDKLAEMADALISNFADAATMLSGDDFNTSSAVGNTSSLSRPEAE